MQVQDLAWFRIADNHPFVIDGTVIDRSTFSRATNDLPSGHQYAANGNYRVAQTLGSPNTQAVMYGGAPFGLAYGGLAADDVNMVRMARTGADRIANTADDYRPLLVFQATCAGATIQVVPDPIFLDGAFGACDSDLSLSFPQGGPLKVHYSLVPAAGLATPRLRVNTNFVWDFGPDIFSAGFEGGTTAEWSSVSP